MNEEIIWIQKEKEIMFKTVQTNWKLREATTYWGTSTCEKGEKSAIEHVCHERNN